MKCPHCQNDFQAEEDADDRLARTTCSPLRVAYSRAELADKLKDWMVEMWGHPLELSEESRDRWMERNGMIYAFICDHFPPANARGMAAGADGPRMPSERTD